MKVSKDKFKSGGKQEHEEKGGEQESVQELHHEASGIKHKITHHKDGKKTHEMHHEESGMKHTVHHGKSEHEHHHVIEHGETAHTIVHHPDADSEMSEGANHPDGYPADGPVEGGMDDEEQQPGIAED